MSYSSRIAKFAAVACIAGGVFALPVQAFAGTGQIVINISKAGFVVGVAGGNGTLTFNGQNYPLSVGGLSLGLTIGLSKAQMYGEVLNINSVNDIVGTYGRVGASAAVGVGGQNMILENGKVQLKLRGRQQGFDASLDAGGMTIKLK